MSGVDKPAGVVHGWGMNRRAVSCLCLGLTFGALALPHAAIGTDEVFGLRFVFGPGPAGEGTVRVGAADPYTDERGFGLEPGASVEDEGGCITASPGFAFSVAVPEGNYDVTVVLGSERSAGDTTVKAESRRLMAEGLVTAPGKEARASFTVNVRRPAIDGKQSVRINKRESGPPLARHWDGKLTLEFCGLHPCLRGIEIRRNERALTVFIAGDSTVTDQTDEPWAGWGQMLPRFLKPGVAVANHAESGLSLRSFKAQKRLDKMLASLRPGDFVLVQFGHNDQKDKTPGAGPFTTYKSNLKDFVARVRAGGGKPVLVAPMDRRRFGPDGRAQPTLAEYAEAVRQVGNEESLPVIDLNRMSLAFHTALGPEVSKRAFVHYPMGTFPGQKEELKDDTHHNAYGAYELAKCVVEGIKAGVPGLREQLADGLPPFDPTRPDPPDGFKLAASPFRKMAPKPAGN